MRRSVWLIGIAVSALALVAAGLLTFAPWSGPDGPRAPGDDADADQVAQAVCDYVNGDFVRQIREDATATEVLEAVEDANRLARRAAAMDPQWVALAGGTGALRQALTDDDPDAARVAIGVLTSECRRTS